jgi:hypothetical protein
MLSDSETSLIIGLAGMEKENLRFFASLRMTSCTTFYKGAISQRDFRFAPIDD